jgi:hypothetical protein
VGLSDTLVGAFWVADSLFAFANAGAKAFHLHWGKGGTPSGDSQPNTGVQTNFVKDVSGHVGLACVWRFSSNGEGDCISCCRCWLRHASCCSGR